MAAYQAYLLRIWRETEADPLRALLEDPHTGERLSFTSAAELLAYLTGVIAPGHPPQPDPALLPPDAPHQASA